jgi:hypothetical protein
LDDPSSVERGKNLMVPDREESSLMCTGKHSSTVLREFTVYTQRKKKLILLLSFQAVFKFVALGDNGEFHTGGLYSLTIV